MQRIQPDRVRFDAQLQVQVPRNANGDLEDGVVMVLERIDAVLEIDDVTLRGLVPRLNDMAVEVEVEGEMRVGPDVDDTQEYVHDVLAAGFGVARVEECRLRQIPADPQAAVLEYG